MTPLKVKQKLFEVRAVVHDLHLNSTSFAEHKALGELYESWGGLLDSFLETYYGKYERIKGTIDIQSSTDINVNSYLSKVKMFLDNDINTIVDENNDSDLCNIIAEMKQIVNHTTYLLTLK